MTTSAPTLLAAEAQREAAKAQFLATLEEAKQKLNPAHLAQNAVDNVKDSVVRNTLETVRTKPGTVAAVAGAAILFLARKPLARLVRPADDHTTYAEPAGSDTSSKQRETKETNHE